MRMQRVSVRENYDALAEAVAQSEFAAMLAPETPRRARSASARAGD